MPGEAEVRYLDGDFRVIRPGAFVRCAITGVEIPLEELRYWSVDLQEAYASPEAVLQRHAGAYARQANGRALTALYRLQYHLAERLLFVDDEPHRQRAGAGGERGKLRIAGETDVILFGGEQDEILCVGAGE